MQLFEQSLQVLMERYQVRVKSARLIFPGRSGQFAVRRCYHRKCAAQSVGCRCLILYGLGIRQSRQGARGHHDVPHVSTNVLIHHAAQCAVCAEDSLIRGPVAGVI